MKEAIEPKVAAEVIDDIRRKQPIQDDVAERVNKYPLIDELRELIQKDDIPQLLDMVTSSSMSVGNLALSLLRPFAREERVKSFLTSSWRQATQYKRQLHLMWRLLDDDELDTSIHMEIYQFVRENLQHFVRDTTEWHGGRDRILESCKGRLADPSFPSTKDWAYLCCAIGSSDRESARRLLQQYHSSTNEFTARVAKEMADELPNIHA